MEHIGAGMRGRILKMSRWLGIDPPANDSTREEAWQWFHAHIEEYQEARKTTKDGKSRSNQE